MALNLTILKMSPECLYDVIRKAVRPKPIISPLLLISKTLSAAMTLWRRYDVRMFTADAIFLEKSSVRKRIV